MLLVKKNGLFKVQTKKFFRGIIYCNFRSVRTSRVVLERLWLFRTELGFKFQRVRTIGFYVTLITVSSKKWSFFGGNVGSFLGGKNIKKYQENYSWGID